MVRALSCRDSSGSRVRFLSCKLNSLRTEESSHTGLRNPPKYMTPNLDDMHAIQTSPHPFRWCGGHWILNRRGHPRGVLFQYRMFESLQLLTLSSAQGRLAFDRLSPAPYNFSLVQSSPLIKKTGILGLP
jgi:hypothetical protein